MDSDDPFGQLLPLLLVEIHRAVGAAAKRERLCRVILWYYDTSASCCYLLADAMAESDRLQNAGSGFLTNYTSKGRSKRIEAMIGRDPTLPSFRLFACVYELLCTKGQMDESFERLRRFTQALGLELNRIDWTPYCSVTDDFVIYPQNGTDYYCGTDEDIAASIPAAKRALLSSRELL